MVCNRWNALVKTDFLWKRWCEAYGWEKPSESDEEDDEDEEDEDEEEEEEADASGLLWGLGNSFKRSRLEDGEAEGRRRKKKERERRRGDSSWRKIVAIRYPKWLWFNGFADQGFSFLLSTSRLSSHLPLTSFLLCFPCSSSELLVSSPQGNHD